MSNELTMMELCERARLMGEFQAEGICIALPIDTSAFAMLAAVGPLAGPRACRWIPIQVVAIRTTSEWISRRVEALGALGLVIALIHRSGGEGVTRTYALTPAELINLKMIGMIDLASRASDDRRPTAVCTASAAVEQAMAAYAVTSGQWRKKLTAALAESVSAG